MTNDAIYMEAFERLSRILTEAEALELKDPTAVALATATPEGLPSVRMVLLRNWDERGFTFFTNSTSRKGQELAANRRAALCFHWEALLRQIRIEGRVETIAKEESDAYWNRRPRKSRIGAWASKQSETLDDYKTLVDRVAHFDQKFPGEQIPRPDFWCGYRVVPERIEFWHDQPARLHRRDVYEFVNGSWSHRLLYP